MRGVNTTLDVLDRFRVRHAGSHRTRAGARRPTILKAKGVKVALLAYTALTNGQRIPHPWTLDMARARRIVRDARRARRAGADVVIVNLHWGAEYRRAPTPAQRSLAGALTRSRAVTAVVGQHAHVVQPIRWIHGKPVVFGEGNLLSNQTVGVLPGRLAGRTHRPARPACRGPASGPYVCAICPPTCATRTSPSSTPGDRHAHGRSGPPGARGASFRFGDPRQRAARGYRRLSGSGAPSLERSGAS